MKCASCLINNATPGKDVCPRCWEGTIRLLTDLMGVRGTIMYEQYLELYRITEWKDGAVLKTESLGCDWYPIETVHANIPSKTNLIYVPANDTFAQENMTVRRRCQQL